MARQGSLTLPSVAMALRRRWKRLRRRICWWTERAGRAKENVALARRLRQETTMTLHWIAELLNLG
jgi:hypothetical protein